MVTLYNDLNESIDKEILSYFEDEIKTSKDISYNQWIIKDDNLQYLCKAFSLKEGNEAKENTVNHHDYNCEFKLIKWITEGKDHKEAFTKMQTKEEKLDRHADVIPYDFNAVSKSNNEEKGKNYINASFINGPLSIDNKLFIATQAPLNRTITHFWEMIVYNQSRLILMLSNLTEEGRKKSELYWPSASAELQLNNGYTLSLTKETILIESGLIERIILLNSNDGTNNNEAIEIRHLHSICWPDHSIPQSPLIGNQVIEELILSVNDIKKRYPSSPITVHCGAGAGRTGTFIAIYNIIRCIKHSQLKIYNVFNVVRKLREQRYSMVTDAEQYKYIYDFISDWLQHTNNDTNVAIN